MDESETWLSGYQGSGYQEPWARGVGKRCGYCLEVPRCQGANVSERKKCGSSYLVL